MAIAALDKPEDSAPLTATSQRDQAVRQRQDCALQEQPTPLSRTTSHAASGRTLIGSDNGAHNPWDGGILGPIIQTPDQKQWIDLELLHPKFLKGLSQYAPSVNQEPESKLGKGAAKVRAWARKSKTGVEIRLRRKINNERDEITDIQLMPDPYPPGFANNGKSPPVQELPAMRSVAELADTAIAQATEMDATQGSQPSRSSTGSTLVEPLPRYEREAGTFNAPVVSPIVDSGVPAAITADASDDGVVREVSPIRPAGIRRRASVSQSSIIATPTRGLSLRDSIQTSPELDDAKAASSQYATLLKADLEDVNKKLDEERQLSESLQAIIQALNEEQEQQGRLSGVAGESSVEKSSKTPQLSRLRVANRATYETETDHEPVSRPAASRRKNAGPTRRKKSVTFTRQKQPARSPTGAETPLSGDSEGEPDAATGTLIRKQTLPKRCSTSAGVDAIWRSLIRMQTILLGSDHDLTIRAKADLRASRENAKVDLVAGLSALEQSKVIALRDFGPKHPWAAAFAEDLEKLVHLIQRRAFADGGESADSKTKADAVVSSQKNDVVHDNALITPKVMVSGEEPTVNTALPPLDTTVQTQAVEKEPSPVVGGVEIDSQLDFIYNTGRLPHQPQNNHVAFARLGFAALSRVAWGGIEWLQRNYGPEQPVQTGKTRVRWTCSCGERLHDDFIEKRPGAARALEAYLNRPRGARLAAPGGYTQKGSSPTTAGSSPGHQSFGSSFGAPPSSQTSFSSNSIHHGSWTNGDDKMQQTWSSMPSQLPFSPTYEPPWLLTCAMEDRFTPKVTHLDMSRHKIHSDKDLANSLREHYFNVNKKWWKGLRLRGLTTIEFVQFEVHQNRFADLRKVPDVPVKGRPDYNFEPSDLLPPVGSQYLLHLFKHPEDYDGELITYLRAPKKNGRLQLGVGWGINLVEGFLADKVWIWMSAMFALGSLVFGVVYAVKKHDVQGAFGVAAWIVTLGALAAGWLQACLG